MLFLFFRLINMFKMGKALDLSAKQERARMEEYTASLYAIVTEFFVDVNFHMYFTEVQYHTKSP